MRTASLIPWFDVRTSCAIAFVLVLAAAAAPTAKGEDAAGTITSAQVAQTGLLAPTAVQKQVMSPVAAALDLGVTGRTLFFGYVEFDQDPNAPGGVPGFGPLPSSASHLARAEADKRHQTEPTEE